MPRSTRRHFLRDVGSGMLIAGLGSQLAVELGVASDRNLAAGEPVGYGKLSPWVVLMQELPPDQLQQKMIAELSHDNVGLSDLVAADD